MDRCSKTCFATLALMSLAACGGGGSSDSEAGVPAPSLVVVPNVVGMPESSAAQAVRSAGLTVGTISTVHDPSVPTGQVVDQSPAAGAQVSGGTNVNLTTAVDYSAELGQFETDLQALYEGEIFRFLEDEGAIDSRLSSIGLRQSGQHIIEYKENFSGHVNLFFGSAADAATIFLRLVPVGPDAVVAVLRGFESAWLEYNQTYTSRHLDFFPDLAADAVVELGDVIRSAFQEAKLRIEASGVIPSGMMTSRLIEPSVYWATGANDELVMLVFASDGSVWGADSGGATYRGSFGQHEGLTPIRLSMSSCPDSDLEGTAVGGSERIYVWARSEAGCLLDIALALAR